MLGLLWLQRGNAGHGQIVEPRRAITGYGQRLLLAVHGLRVVGLVVTDGAQIAPGIGVAGLLRQHLAQQRLGQRQLAQLFQQHGQVHLHAAGLRLQRRRLQVVFQRQIQLPQRHAGITAVQPCLPILRVGLQAGIETGNRLLQLPGRHQLITAFECRPVHVAACPSKANMPASSSTVTPSSSALSSLLPASAPATT